MFLLWFLRAVETPVHSTLSASDAFEVPEFNMSDILNKIIAVKREEIVANRAALLRCVSAAACCNSDCLGRCTAKCRARPHKLTGAVVCETALIA